MRIKQNKHFNVIVFSLTESPRILSILPVHQLVNETDSFSIYCNATGNPPPAITWTKVGYTSTVYSTEKTLRVQNAEKSDFGTYRCTVLSVRGEIVSTVATVQLDNCKLNIMIFFTFMYKDLYGNIPFTTNLALSNFI